MFFIENNIVIERKLNIILIQNTILTTRFAYQKYQNISFYMNNTCSILLEKD